MKMKMKMKIKNEKQNKNKSKNKNKKSKKFPPDLLMIEKIFSLHTCNRGSIFWRGKDFFSF